MTKLYIVLKIMKKIKKIFFIPLIFLIVLTSCDSVKEGLTGSKKKNSDEFLIEKKNPLVVPPDFDELPIPDQDIGSAKNSVENESDFKKLLKEGNNQVINNTNNSSNTAEESILKKLKKNSDNK